MAPDHVQLELGPATLEDALKIAASDFVPPRYLMLDQILGALRAAGSVARPAARLAHLMKASPVRIPFRRQSRGATS